MSVVHDTFRPESVCRKKSNSICYHAVCELVTMDEFLNGHIPSTEDVTDQTIKYLYSWLVIFYMIYMVTLSVQIPIRYGLESGIHRSDE